MKFTTEQRALIDTTVLEVLAVQPLTAALISFHVERQIGWQFPIDWRDIDASLQRLRKRGAIKTVRSGSFSHWHRQ